MSQQVFFITIGMALSPLTFSAGGTIILRELEPIQIVEGKLRINENALQEDKIYSIDNKGQVYYIQKSGNTTEVFQLSN